MNPAINLEPKTSNEVLGHLIKKYPLKNPRRTRARWLIQTIVFFVAAFLTIGIGLYFTYLRYYWNGPAVVQKQILYPAIAAAILLGLGIWAAITTYQHWNLSAGLYEGGIIYTDGWGPHVWGWKEITAIRIGVFAPLAKGLNLSTKWSFAMKRKTGELLLLDDFLIDVDQLTGEIRKRVIPLIYEKALEELKAGNSIRFANLEISQEKGVKAGSTWTGWNQVQGVDVKRGVMNLRIATKNGKSREVSIPVRKIDNLDVLVNVINQYQINNG